MGGEGPRTIQVGLTNYSVNWGWGKPSSADTGLSSNSSDVTLVLGKWCWCSFTGLLIRGWPLQRRSLGGPQFRWGEVQLALIAPILISGSFGGGSRNRLKQATVWQPVFWLVLTFLGGKSLPNRQHSFQCHARPLGRLLVDLDLIDECPVPEVF